MNESTIYLNIADFDIELNFRSTDFVQIRKNIEKDILYYFQPFLSKHITKTVNYRIDFVWEENTKIISIKEDNEYYVNLYKKTGENSLVCYYRINITEFQFIIKYVLNSLLTKNNGWFLHASVLGNKDQAYIFLGDSGSGKSTIIELLNTHFQPLADDVCIVKKVNNYFYLFQTPFFEKLQGIKKNSNKYKINKIFFLKKNRQNTIKRIEERNIILGNYTKQMITENSFLNNNMKEVLEFISGNKFYFLYFSNNKDKLVNFFMEFTNTLITIPRAGAPG